MPNVGEGAVAILAHERDLLLTSLGGPLRRADLGDSSNRRASKAEAKLHGFVAAR